MKGIFFSTIFTLLVLCAPLQAAGKIKLAYFELPGKGRGPTALKAQLKRIGHSGTDALKKLRDGRFKLSSCKALLVGSFAMSDWSLQQWFRKEKAALRNFVSKGGVVIVLAQDCNDWDIEPWLPESALVMRDRARYRSLAYLDGAHPLFNTPHTIGLDRLNADWKGDKQWPGGFLSWWTIRKARCAAVLAAHDKDRSRPWCVEIGWGRGRCLFFSCAPDRVPEGQPEAARRICDALLENTLRYAATVQKGDAHPLPEEALIADEKVHERIYLRPMSAQEEKELETRVNAAVDRGVAWLLSKQKEDGSWGYFSDGWSNKYASGLTALSLLALMNSGVSKYKQPVEKGFEYLFGHRPQHTYEISFCLMALEMKAAPMLERFRVARLDPDERKNYKYERTLTPDEKSYMHDLVELLTTLKSRGGNWRYNLRQSQPDISNGQFAILGLKAASRCGIKVPVNIWEEVLEYYLDFQAKEGPKTKYREFKSFDRNGAPEFRVYAARERGWSYHFGYADPAKTVGSHVNIGISCLLLAYEELTQRRSAVAASNRGAVRQAVRDGLAWLDGHWAIETRPNSSKVYYHYYIYSLGRVGTLTDRRFIGEHDWYREGVAYLLEKQCSDGHWGIRPGEWGSNISATAFTLLFLMRSTPPPVITVGG